MGGSRSHSEFFWCGKSSQNSLISVGKIRQTEFVVNTCVTAPISIIDAFVSYVVIEKKYYLICFPRDLSHFYTLATVSQ